MKNNELLIKDLSAFYSLEEKLFLEEGTSFRLRSQHDEENLIYVSRYNDRAIITAGEKLISFLKGKISPHVALSEKQLGEILSEVKLLESHFNYIHSGENLPESCLSSEFSLKNVHPDDHASIQAFIDICSEEDIDDAEIYLDDPDEEIRMVYTGETPVAYGAYRRWGKNLGDVGILVHEDFRRKGLGAAAVIAATKAALERSVIPLYRTCCTNHGSKAIAEKTGFNLTWTTRIYKYNV